MTIRLIICVQLLMIMTVSCNDAAKEKHDSIPVDSVKSTQLLLNTDSASQPVIHWEDYSALIPLELKDSTSNNVYEKYGIEFSGNCYACDLAAISITKGQFDMINVCDEKDVFRIKDFTCSMTEKELTIKTKGSEFHITKMDEAPVYRLEIKGERLELKNKRLSIYFTHKSAINKFKEHDCGDFQG